MGLAGLRPLSHELLWLLRVAPGCQQCLWDVAALAAHSVIRPDRFTLRVTYAGRVVGRVSRAQLLAVANFWARLPGLHNPSVHGIRCGDGGTGHLFLRVIGATCCVMLEPDLHGGGSERGHIGPS